jgi:hypothetical protein
VVREFEPITHSPLGTQWHIYASFIQPTTTHDQEISQSDRIPSYLVSLRKKWHIVESFLPTISISCRPSMSDVDIRFKTRRSTFTCDLDWSQPQTSAAFFAIDRQNDNEHHGDPSSEIRKVWKRFGEEGQQAYVALIYIICTYKLYYGLLKPFGSFMTHSLRQLTKFTTAHIFVICFLIERSSIDSRHQFSRPSIQ